MTVGRIMGWSTATTVRMIAEVYGHIGQSTLKRAIQQREEFEAEQSKRWLQFGTVAGKVQ
jgi:hypothetical protein